jgi:hypothetical protein
MTGTRATERNRDGSAGMAPRLLLLAFLAGACNVEHYQILPDWTPDETADASTESPSDVSDDEETADVPGESEDQDVQDDEDDGGPPICRDPGEDADLLCDPGLVCCEFGPLDLCIDLSGDPRHCGACTRECDPGQECAGGTCLDP